MVLIGAVLLLSWLLATRTVQRLVPFESFLALAVAGVASLALYELGRLG